MAFMVHLPRNIPIPLAGLPCAEAVTLTYAFSNFFQCRTSFKEKCSTKKNISKTFGNYIFTLISTVESVKLISEIYPDGQFLSTYDSAEYPSQCNSKR
jgi:hypothetical protein